MVVADWLRLAVFRAGGNLFVEEGRQFGADILSGDGGLLSIGGLLLGVGSLLEIQAGK